MRSLLASFTLLLLAGCGTQSPSETDVTTTTSAADSAAVEGPLLTHSVFFDLKENDAASVQTLVDGAYKYLEPHDGIVHFSAGPRHTDYNRDVNDLDFDVALTIVFENTAAQEAYQVTQPHQQFIIEHEDNWKKVRVFDSFAPGTLSS